MEYRNRIIIDNHHKKRQSLRSLLQIFTYFEIAINWCFNFKWVKQLLNQKQGYFIIFYSCFIMLFSSCIQSYAALSAITAKSIKGTEPYLLLPDNTKVTNINQLFNITIPKQDGTSDTKEIDASMSGEIIHISEGIKFQDIILSVLADGNPHEISGAVIADDDGDADLLSNTSIVGDITATWYNGTISGSYKVTDLNQTIPACEGPYYLRIRSPNVNISTKYGTPRSKIYTSQTITYTFSMGKHGICYLQPELTAYSGATNATATKSKWPYQNESNPGGYNPDKWIYKNGKHMGFKKDAGFPTTGFNMASFNLISAGNDQSKYMCELDSGNAENWVKLSGSASKTIGQGCTITYNKEIRPTSPLTINMKYYDGSTWLKTDSYIIPKPTLWAIKGSNATRIEYNTVSDFSGLYKAAISCGAPSGLSGKENQAIAAGYFFKRNELTNSPIANLTPPTTIRDGYYSRDVDGTFTGEWGMLNKYPSAGWEVYPYNYWTSETTNEKGQYLVLSHGLVFSDYLPNAQSSAMCKK